jgi:hypothetical protein
MIKLRIATELGLLILMAAMACGPARMSQARANGGGITLASLAGKFTSKGSGSYTVCFTDNFTMGVDCASAQHQEVQFKVTTVSHPTRDAAGNSCGVTTASNTATDGPDYGAKFPARMNFTRTNVSTTTSFDPTTGSGSSNFRQYLGGRCDGAVFDSTGAVLTGTGTQSFMVSDSGNRIETIIMSFSVVTNPFGVAGMVKETMPMIKTTYIRQSD